MKRLWIWALPVMLLAGCGSSPMKSPSGRIHARFFTTADGSLAYRVDYDDRIVCDTSALGLCVDGIPLYRETELISVTSAIRNETYPVRGVHDMATDHCRKYTWSVRHNPTKYVYTLQARLYDDGFAYRLILPGKGLRHIDHEAAQWRFPQESRVWFAERNSSWKLLTYAGEWTRTEAGALSRISSQGPLQTMPLLYRATDGPYLMVAEAALYNYSGMRLRARAGGSLTADFTEPEGFDIRDTITTPWRVLIVADDLDALVNTDIITNLNPSPDPALFADTSWIKPGRSLWSWWSEIDGRYMTVEGEKAVIDLASDMGYEYTTLDEGWEEMPHKWETLKMLCDHAATRHVGVFVWRHWNRLNDPADDYAQMCSFMDSVAACGVKGLKIDFMNGEALRQVTFTTKVLENAAKRRLLINFHGCQKPSGESRTYPNELTREGVRGMELNRITANYLQEMAAAGKDVSNRQLQPGDENQCLSAVHNVTLPFTRCILGAADYTPVGFSMPGDVLPGQHLALAYLITSPLTVLAENPFFLQREASLKPAFDLLRTLPTCWERTIVLPPSEPGRIAAFARKSEDVWYLAVATVDPSELRFDLNFLDRQEYTATIIEDDGDGGLRQSVTTIRKGDPLNLALYPRGGAVVRFEIRD